MENDKTKCSLILSINKVSPRNTNPIVYFLLNSRRIEFSCYPHVPPRRRGKLCKVPEFFSRKESSAMSRVKLGNKIIIFKRPQTSIAMTYSLSDLIILSNIKIKRKREKRIYLLYKNFLE